MRDGPEDTQVVSAVEVIEVGQDQNGKTLTSLVVRAQRRRAPGHSELAPRSERVPRRLEGCPGRTGGDFQPEAGDLPVRAVSQACVRERFYETYAEAEEDEKKRREKIRKAFQRALGDAQLRASIFARDAVAPRP